MADATVSSGRSSPIILDDPPSPWQDTQDWEAFSGPAIGEGGDSYHIPFLINDHGTTISASWVNRGTNDRVTSNYPHNSMIDDNILTTSEDPSSLISFVETHVPRSLVKVDKPPEKRKKISNSQTEDMNQQTCPICFEPWGDDDHKLVALECGHLFGSKCIEKLLQTQGTEGSCPTCKSKATLNDIRFIYARRVVAVDTAEVVKLQNQVISIQSEKCKTVLELQKTNIAHRACALQLEVLRSTLKKSQVKEPVRRSWHFALEKDLTLCKDGGCRVLTYNSRTNEFYVSAKSSNNFLAGYGIRNVNCSHYTLGEFVVLHSKVIPDITYSQSRDLLLTASHDSSARIVERGVPIMTVKSRVPLYACSWDFMRTNEFFVGGSGGIIQQYDIRNPSAYVQVLYALGDLSPIVSLCSTEFGLLSCQPDSCKQWVPFNLNWQPRQLPVEGSFMSLCYDNESHRVLVSRRPKTSSLVERSSLIVCKFDVNVSSGEVLFDVEETFPGSTRSAFISRAAWVKAPGASWVAAHSESDSALNLLGLDGARTMSLPAAEPAIDLCSGHFNGNIVLAALSDSRLRLYKAVSTCS